MNKKYIASACVALVGLSAFAVAQAQTNTTLYGLVDYGYAYRWDAKTPGTNTPGNQSQLNGGQSAENRLGIKGTEDLGNGIKAVFLLEQGFQLDTGAQQQSNTMFSRQAYVGLNGGFGTIVGGRMLTPHYTFVSSIDPFNAGTVGRYSNVFSPLSALQTSYGTVMDPTRVDNAVQYTTPTFSGLSVTGMFSNNAVGQESSAGNTGNNTMYGVLGKYETGPVMVGVNYHYIAAGTVGLAGSLNNAESVSVGGTYDFKVAKVAALYSYNDVEYNLNTSGNVTLNNYLVGVTVPVGKWAGKASYVYSDGNSNAGGDAQQLALGVDYNLSKRTALYSAYSWVDNQDNRYGAVGDASNTGGYTAGTLATTGVYQQGIQAGLRHAF